jgi:hypothetical protein
LLFLSLVHLVLAPVLLPVRASSMEVVGAVVDRAQGSIPDSADIRDRTVIIVNAPFDIMASYVQVMRESRGQNRPRHLHWLAVSSSPLEIGRAGERTLRVRPRAGFLHTPPERHYRGSAAGLGRGAVVRLPEMKVTVTEVTDDGRPQAAEFEFRRGLDRPGYLFLVYDKGKYRPFNLPAAGQTVELPAEDFFRTMVSELLGIGATAPGGAR